MIFVYWVLAGLLVGWAGGRLMMMEHDIPNIGLLGDLVWGVIGSVAGGWAIRLIVGPPRAGMVEAVLAGVVGALAATFVQRAYGIRSERTAW